MARALDRLRTGDFGGTDVHFHQRNITQTIFENESIDTTICNSTTHELYSYGEGEKTVWNYLSKKFAQTRKRGRLLIRDVVGPENKRQDVIMWLNDNDGERGDVFETFSDSDAFRTYLDEVSTYGRLQPQSWPPTNVVIVAEKRA